MIYFVLCWLCINSGLHIFTRGLNPRSFIVMLNQITNYSLDNRTPRYPILDLQNYWGQKVAMHNPRDGNIWVDLVEWLKPMVASRNAKDVLDPMILKKPSTRGN